MSDEPITHEQARAAAFHAPPMHHAFLTTYIAQQQAREKQDAAIIEATRTELMLQEDYALLSSQTRERELSLQRRLDYLRTQPVGAVDQLTASLARVTAERDALAQKLEGAALVCITCRHNPCDMWCSAQRFPAEHEIDTEPTTEAGK